MGKNTFLERVSSRAGKAMAVVLKNKSLDDMAKITIAQFYLLGGKNPVRVRVIEAAEQDIAKCIKKGMVDEDILKPVLASPNYLKLLDMVDLNVDHLRVIINEKRTDSIRPY